LQNELSYCRFTSQSYFLLSLGLVSQLRKAEQQSDTSQHYSFLNIQRLMSLSKKMKILILKKNVADAGLLGLQFPLQL
jgi:SAM-dependent MidA family methyltransferase